MTDRVKTPVFLLVLCIISFVAVFFTSLYDLMLIPVSAISDGELMNMINQSPMSAQFTSDMLGMLRKLTGNAWLHLLFNVVEVVGLIMLLCKRWVGLHVYIASQIGLMYVTFVVFGMGGILIYLTAILWIVLYICAVRSAKNELAFKE